MDKIVEIINTTIETKKSEYEQISEKAKLVENEYNETISTLNEEMLRLQGEYRALSNLLKQLNESKM